MDKPRITFKLLCTHLCTPPQMTARGALPFAFLYTTFYTTLRHLLPDVSTSLEIKSIKIACPNCHKPKSSLSFALRTLTMECFDCHGDLPIDISGLALWSSDEASLANALAAAHREVLNNTAEATTAVNFAYAKLVRCDPPACC